MSEFIFEQLKNQLTESLTDSIVADLQNDLARNFAFGAENIYDITEQIKSKFADVNKLDINTLLKYYTINQLLKDTKKEDALKNYSTKYINTNNPNYRKNTEDNCYYRVCDGKLVLDKKVSEIFEDGSYVRIETQKYSLYKSKKTYDIEDNVTSIHLIDPQGKSVLNKTLAAEILEMRKEYVEKYKYSGISGNSKDFITKIKNSFLQPTATGLYMDKQYHLYNWSDYRKCFVRNTKMEKLSPLLTEYDFKDSRTVIRKEFTGV